MTAARLLRLLSVILFAFGVCAVRAGTPPMMTFQGRVAVQGTNFTGTGHFKFALVSTNGTTTLWSHDGTSVGGGAPLSSLSLSVARGLFAVQLGDTSLPGMGALPASVFTNREVALRVWFDDGVAGFQQMTPDQRIASVPYAFVAGRVAEGGVGPEALDAAVDARYVNAAGDTMTGALQVPSNGLRAAGDQFVLEDGHVGIGTATPSSPLTVVGEDASGSYTVEFFSGTNRIGWGRRK